MLFKEHIEYEIYASNVHGSDVMTADTLDKAIEIAEKWSMEEIDTDIIIERVKRVVFKKFRHGGEVA